MGDDKKEIERLRELKRTAEAILLRTNAILNIDGQEGSFRRANDDGAERAAYKVAASMVRDGTVDGTSADMMQAVKSILGELG